MYLFHHYAIAFFPNPDSFESDVTRRNSSDNIYCCSRSDIAWDSDLDVRFRNPGGSSNISAEDLTDTTMPPNWPLDLSHIEDGLQNESLVVWYRVSAFPVFRKLYGRMMINGSLDEELPKGEYSIVITYSILCYEGQLMVYVT